MAAVATHLADTSALARLRHAPVQVVLAPLIEAGLVAIPGRAWRRQAAQGDGMRLPPTQRVTGSGSQFRPIPGHAWRRQAAHRDGVRLRPSQRVRRAGDRSTVTGALPRGGRASWGQATACRNGNIVVRVKSYGDFDDTGPISGATVWSVKLDENGLARFGW